jgi:hypothetical protein
MSLAWPDHLRLSQSAVIDFPAIRSFLVRTQAAV